MKKFVWLLVFLIPLLLLYSPVLASSDTDDLRRMLEELRKEVETLKKENAELRSQVEELKKAQIPAAAPVVAPSKHSFYSKGGYGSTPSGIDFYGFFKIDAVWQDSSAVGDIYVLYVLPDSKGGGDNKFTLNFRHSRFGFDFSKPYKTWNLFGKMEMDFYTECHNEETLPWNANHSPLRARRVFVGVEKGTWQLLAGLDWLTISQLYPHTSNFPAGTFMGNPAYRMPQVRLTKWFKINDVSQLKFQIAAEKPYGFPPMNGIVWDEDPANDAGFPGIEARIAYETKLFGKPALAAVWGHYSEEEYATQYGDKDAESYSIGLEAKFPLPIQKKAFLLGEIWYGRNFDGYYSCGVNQGTRFTVYFDDGTTQQTKYVTDLRDSTLKKVFENFDPDTNKYQVLSVDEIDAWGGWIELELFWTPKLVTHFGWGIDNPDNDDLAGVSGARLQQQMFYTNFLYRLTKEFGFGMEYMYVRTDYRQSDGGDGKLNRFMGSFYYFF